MKKTVWSFGLIILAAISVSILGHWYATAREKGDLSLFASEDGANYSSTEISKNNVKYAAPPSNLSSFGVSDNNFGTIKWETVTSNDMSGYSDIVVTIDKTHFPDPYMRYAAYFRDDNNDGKLSKKEIRETTGFTHYLYESDAGIGSLAGLEYFTNLEKIDLGGEPLANADFSPFTKLNYLSIYKCPNIQSVNVTGNSGLESLNVWYCDSLSDIKFGKNLESLMATYNPLITSFSFPSGSKLKYLSCYQDEGINTLNVSSLSYLEALSCEGCNISTLTFSDKNSKLSLLDCSKNKLTSLNLKNLTSLDYLYCEKNNLVVLRLPKNEMHGLSCYRNSLRTLDLFGQTYLSYAYMNGSAYENHNYDEGYTYMSYTGSYNGAYAYLSMDKTTELSFHGEDVNITTCRNGKGGVYLAWNTTPNAVRYEVWRKFLNDDWLLLAGKETNTHLDNLAIPGNFYYYCVRGVDADGKYISSDFIFDECITYYDYYPRLTVTEEGKGAKLSWPSAGGDTFSYQIIRNEEGTNWNKAYNVMGSPFIDDDIIPGKTYTYRIYCLDYDDEYLNEDDPDKITFRHSLLIPLTLKYEKGNVNISWDAVEGVSAYRVFRCALGEAEFKGITKVTSPKYTDKTVEPGKRYTYYVKPIDENGKYIPYDYANTAYIDIPDIEADFYLDPVGDGVGIFWEAVDGVASYRIFRRAEYEDTFTGIKKTTSTSYIDKTAEPGTTYYYYVRCIDANGKYVGTYNEEGKSIEVPVIIEADFTLQNVDNGVKIFWDAVDGVASYRIFRKAGGEDTFTGIKKTTNTSFVDKTVEPGCTYSYYVRCIGENGKYIGTYNEEGVEIEVPAIIEADFDLELVPEGVSIVWEAVDGVASYRIFRKADWEDTFTGIKKTTNTSFVDKTVEPGCTYSYYVRCIGENGKYIGTYNAEGIEIEIPMAIEADFQLRENDDMGVVITWEPVDGVAAYRIFRAKDGDAGFSAIKKTTGTEYVDKTTQGGCRYQYYIRCIDANGKYIGTYTIKGITVGLCDADALEEDCVEEIIVEDSFVEEDTTAVEGADLMSNESEEDAETVEDAETAEVPEEV